MIDTPYVRRIREAGREEGVLMTRRQAILQILTLRFGPQEVSLMEALEQTSDAARLEALFTAAVQSADLGAFRAVLHGGA